MTLHMYITRWSIPKSDWLYSCSQRWRSCIQSAKTRLGADCGSDHELLSAKWKVKVNQLHPTLCDPKDYTVHGILQTRILEWVAFPFFQGIFPNPGIKPMSSTLQADSLSAEPPGKPKNTGVGSQSCHQWIFLIQESNQGLLHYRQILC